MPLGELTKRCLPYLMQAGIVKKESEMVLKAVGLIQERLKYLSEVVELCDYFFAKPKYEAELLIPKKSTKDETRKALEEAYKYLEEEKDFGRDSTEQLLRALAEKMNLNAGVILWPIRVALTGKTASPGVFELIDVFGKEETLARIKTAIDML
jgi:glutamyl-tRNA synthetase